MGCPLRYHPGKLGVATEHVAVGTYAGGAFGPCLREQCDWWHSDERRCILPMLADYTRVMYRFMSAWWKATHGDDKQPPGPPTATETAPAASPEQRPTPSRDFAGIDLGSLADPQKADAT